MNISGFQIRNIRIKANIEYFTVGPNIRNFQISAYACFYDKADEYD